MDLLGDLGNNDQLISARAENKVLQARVKELTGRVKVLTVENAALTAEVEMYRKERAEQQQQLSSMMTGENGSNQQATTTRTVLDEEDFMTSGDGVYPTEVIASLPVTGGAANPLCCALDSTDSILGSGCADGSLVLCPWGLATAPHASAVQDCLQSKSARSSLGSPIICTAFSTLGTNWSVIAAAGMDGSVHVLVYEKLINGAIVFHETTKTTFQHNKYVKTLSWGAKRTSDGSQLLASGSADGTIRLTRVKLQIAENDDMDEVPQLTLETLKTLHLKGTIEATAFVNDGNTLVWYERDTPFLTYLNMHNDWEITKYSLNGDAPAGGFHDHVSFAVMHLVLSPNGKYLCAATDTSRNIIMQVGTSNIVRNLYGHQNDSFSQPRVAWSKNGHYIFGNAQDDGSTTIIVWDIASSDIITRFKGIHRGQVRDIFSSPTSDTLITASYDKTVKIWANSI